MNRLDIEKEVRNSLGYAQGLDAGLIHGTINNAQFRLESKDTLPWFLEKQKDITIPIGVDFFNLPTDYLHDIHGVPLSHYDSATVIRPLEKITYANKEELTRGVYASCVAFYYRYGTKMFITPVVPDTIEHKVSLKYYGSDVLLGTDSSVNNWSTYAPWVLIFQTLIILSEHRSDRVKIGLYAQELQSALRSLYERSSRMQTDNIDYAMRGVY